jgi:hypothetical protein
MKNIESQYHIMDCKSLRVRKKKSGIPLFTLQAFLKYFSRIGQKTLIVTNGLRGENGFMLLVMASL